MKQELLLTHTVGMNTRIQATKFAHCFVQGHHHSEFCIAYYADHLMLRWGMSVGWMGDIDAPPFRYANSAASRPAINGLGLILTDKERYIVISDTHFPYQHPDFFDFIKRVKLEYGITHALHVGDVVDNHYPSYHEKEVDALSGDEEIVKARLCCQELEELFPKMLIAEGNHDRLPKRKAKSAMLPEAHLRDYNDTLQVGSGWVWKQHHYISIGEGKPLLIPMVHDNRGRWDKRLLP